MKHQYDNPSISCDSSPPTLVRRNTSHHHSDHSLNPHGHGEEWTGVNSLDLQSSSDFEVISESELPARHHRPRTSFRPPSLLIPPVATAEPPVRRPLPNSALDSQSDSLTSFDPQAWKRGDEGTSRKPKKRSSHSPLQASFTRTEILNNSRKFEEGFPNSSSSRSQQQSRVVVSNEIRRMSNSQSSSQSVSAPRIPPGSIPSSWRPYVRPTKPVDPEKYETREELILDALATLCAMSSPARLAAWSSSRLELDDSQPMHADMPTSPMNSAVDEEEGEVVDDDEEIHSPTWCIRLGNLFTAKTWQIVGISGLVLGIGIGAGTLMSVRAQRVPRFIVQWIRINIQ